MKYVKKKRKDPKRGLLITLCVLLCVLLAILIGAFIWLKLFLSDINRIDGSDSTLSQSEIESILSQTDPVDPGFTGPVLNENEVITPSTPAQNITVGSNTINFLLVGQDRRPGDPRMHSDAMILVTVNKTQKTVTMTSFMRDLWVEIPGYYTERINVPYMVDPVNGFDLLNKTLQYNFGVSGDHNVEVDFSGFTAAIEAVGGVTIDLTEAEAALMNRQNGWSLSAGPTLLTGKEALAYSRIRAIGNDFGRTSRQRTVLMALFEKAKTLSITQLYSLAKTLTPLLTTDMTDSEIVSYIVELAPILPELTIVSQRIPADGAYYDAVVRGNQVLCMDAEDWQINLQLLEKTLGN